MCYSNSKIQRNISLCKKIVLNVIELLFLLRLIIESIYTRYAKIDLICMHIKRNCLRKYVFHYFCNLQLSYYLVFFSFKHKYLFLTCSYFPNGKILSHGTYLQKFELYFIVFVDAKNHVNSQDNLDISWKFLTKVLK